MLGHELFNKDIKLNVDKVWDYYKELKKLYSDEKNEEITDPLNEIQDVFSLSTPEDIFMKFCQEKAANNNSIILICFAPSGLNIDDFAKIDPSIKVD